MISCLIEDNGNWQKKKLKRSAGKEWGIHLQVLKNISDRNRITKRIALYQTWKSQSPIYMTIREMLPVQELN